MLLIVATLTTLVWAVLASSSDDSAGVIIQKPDQLLDNYPQTTSQPLKQQQAQITNFLLPQSNRRCGILDNGLSYIDHSLLISTQQPDDSILDNFVLCDSSVTWAAVSSNSDDLGGAIAWRIAFRINSAPDCGDRLFLNSSDYSELAQHQHWHNKIASESKEFNCTNRVYPYLHKAKYRYSRLSWLRANQSLPSSMTVSVLVYARYRNRASLTRRRQIRACLFQNGFWCGSKKANSSGGHCIYGNHVCNGYDDCLDTTSAAISGNETVRKLPSDEINCSGHQHESDFMTVGAIRVAPFLSISILLLSLFQAILFVAD